ncbi:MAG: hypothetical protein ACJA1A_002766 [Saprospiraceae bacterium]|jgi:hypothetical protein|tara:strand:+ start:363 stop:470 length:108 start_codon:yes stop_codon:yes gene_type:complete
MNIYAKLINNIIFMFLYKVDDTAETNDDLKLLIKI